MGPDKSKLEALEKRIAGLGIRKTDLEEKFIKSSGRGGQKVNKTSSAVFIRHVPTGIAVKYGKHRSQHLNRFMALRLLADQVEAKLTGNPGKQAVLMEKIKKQKQRRKRKTRKKLDSPSSACPPLSLQSKHE